AQTIDENENAANGCTIAGIQSARAALPAAVSIPSVSLRKPRRSPFSARRRHGGRPSQTSPRGVAKPCTSAACSSPVHGGCSEGHGTRAERQLRPLCREDLPGPRKIPPDRP